MPALDFPAMNTKALQRCLAILILPFIMIGCRSGYDVEVRNLTDQPVTARLYRMHADGAPRTIVSRRAGPGDRASLFSQHDSMVRVMLEVDFAGNVGYPATLDLVRGRTIVNVRRVEEGTHGRIRLEEIPRP